MLRLLRELSRDEGRTVVMVTHDPSAAAVADRVVFLRDGRVAGEVTGGSTRSASWRAASATSDGRVAGRASDRPAATAAGVAAMLRSLDGLAVRQLRARPLRAALTAFGVVLGVGDGLRRAAARRRRSGTRSTT